MFLIKEAFGEMGEIIQHSGVLGFQSFPYSRSASSANTSCAPISQISKLNLREVKSLKECYSWGRNEHSSPMEAVLWYVPL